MTTSRTVRVGAVVLAQLLLVVVAVWAPLSARAVGEEVRLRVTPVDPYDPFRGAYVDLGYPDLPGQPMVEADTRTEEQVQAEQDARGTAYVPLVKEGEVWVGRPVERVRPASGTYLTCDDTSWRLECGIENWFLPQDQASALEDAVRGGTAIARVKVDGRGHAALVGVETR
ncbi:MAG: GDYXXLXY domain-containing protein [Ornithinibacter sp.]